MLLSGSPLILSGGSGNNTFYLREDSDAKHLDIWINAATPGSGTPTQSDLISNISTVTITGNGVNDTLTIDFSNGDPFPSTVAFTGGTGSNTMTIDSGNGGSTMQISGSAVNFGSTAIAYTATESIIINGGSGNDTLTQTAQPTATLVFNGGAGNDTLTVNAGGFLLAGDPASATTNLTVNDNAWLFFASASAGTGINARHLTALNIGASATALVDSPPSASDRAVLVLGSLSINATGELDLTGNDLIVHNGNLTSINSNLAAGQITSSLAAHVPNGALGDELNSIGTGVLMSSFDGQSAVNTDVLVKFTVVGDANLDGVVNGSDFTLIDNGLNNKLTGWRNGDFNYDGTVNGDDYTLIDNAFNTASQQPDPLVYQLENAQDIAELQSLRTIGAIGTSSNYPQYTNPNGTWNWVTADQWTAGFTPGILWELYAATGNPYFKTEATQFTLPLSVDDTNTGDVGFEVFDSFDPLLQQEPGNSSVIQVMLNAAASKATQYNATVGAFEAWRASTSGNPLANFNVLMDYIMDSNLLFWAAQQTGNQTYYNEAVQNAITEETFLVRADGSSAQFAYFNSATGQFIDNEAYEGYSASSTWSRGEAWGIYGFTMCYQQTGRSDFLATAEKMANYFLANLPSDDVPYWDFDAPGIPNTYRDTSAASIAAAGLLQLSDAIAVSDPTDSAKYRSGAAAILASLSTNYLANPASPGDGVLLQGALNVPASPSVNDNSLIFGDYYYLQAISEYLAG